MKERPILFSTEMVKAILDGRKTQTRRVVKDLPKWVTGVGYDREDEDDLPWLFYGEEKYAGWDKCPYGIPGDRLWVRETWCYVGEVPGPEIIYKATTPDFMGWCSPAIMPRWASRITLEILSTRVERLKQITDSDCYAEGIESDISDVMGEPRIKFARLWDTLNAKRGYPWADNPFVWVIEFRLLA